MIYNPTAGRGKARKLLEAARHQFGMSVEYKPTDGPWHAAELARKAAVDGFARVIAAGGDGTVHEVANGLLTAGRDDVILSIWPVGSMNDLAYSLGLLRWWKEGATQPLETMLIDVGVSRTSDRERYFVNGCGIGFNALVARESRTIRFLRGQPLYVWALLRSLLKHYSTPPLVVQRDSSKSIEPTLCISFNLGQREGGFPVTPDARLDDGEFDVLHVKNLQRWELLRYLPGLIIGQLPNNHPRLTRARCNAACIRSDWPLVVHTDGELLVTPEDHISELKISLFARKLLVEVYPPFLNGG